MVALRTRASTMGSQPRGYPSSTSTSSISTSSNTSPSSAGLTHRGAPVRTDQSPQEFESPEVRAEAARLNTVLLYRSAPAFKNAWGHHNHEECEWDDCDAPDDERIRHEDDLVGKVKHFRNYHSLACRVDDKCHKDGLKNLGVAGHGGPLIMAQHLFRHGIRVSLDAWRLYLTTLQDWHQKERNMQWVFDEAAVNEAVKKIEDYINKCKQEKAKRAAEAKEAAERRVAACQQAAAARREAVERKAQAQQAAAQLKAAEQARKLKQQEQERREQANDALLEQLIADGRRYSGSSGVGTSRSGYNGRPVGITKVRNRDHQSRIPVPSRRSMQQRRPNSSPGSSPLRSRASTTLATGTGRPSGMGGPALKGSVSNGSVTAQGSTAVPNREIAWGQAMQSLQRTLGSTAATQLLPNHFPQAMNTALIEGTGNGPGTRSVNSSSGQQVPRPSVPPNMRSGRRISNRIHGLHMTTGMAHL